MHTVHLRFRSVRHLYLTAAAAAVCFPVVAVAAFAWLAQLAAAQPGTTRPAVQVMAQSSDPERLVDAFLGRAQFATDILAVTVAVTGIVLTGLTVLFFLVEQKHSKNILERHEAGMELKLAILKNELDSKIRHTSIDIIEQIKEERDKAREDVVKIREALGDTILKTIEREIEDGLSNTDATHGQTMVLLEDVMMTHARQLAGEGGPFDFVRHARLRQQLLKLLANDPPAAFEALTILEKEYADDRGAPLAPRACHDLRELLRHLRGRGRLRDPKLQPALTALLNLLADRAGLDGGG